MPELPEVETTRRALLDGCQGRVIDRVVVRERRLRWPVPADFETHLTGARIETLGRRAKYLLLGLRRGPGTGSGHVILHLGMSGSLRLLPADTAPQRHDHLDLLLDSGRLIRLRDPRRFGSVHWWDQPPETHPLLRHLGPEPLDLDAAALGTHLHRAARNRRSSVKALLMDGRIVVGVGNIYASEALFLAALRPGRAAASISGPGYARLAGAIRQVMQDALAAGGTTLRDYTRGDGQPGYFAQQLRVYGRAGAPCRVCGNAIRQLRHGQRSSFYCAGCQR